MPLAEETEFEDLLGATIAPLGFELSGSEIEGLRAHYELLVHWNRRINLTSVREPREIVERHFGESLFLAARMPKVGSVVDVGSGAGFPGLPVAVVRRGLKVTLVESVGKKAAFLRECARDYGSVKVCGCRLSEEPGSALLLALGLIGVAMRRSLRLFGGPPAPEITCESADAHA